MDISRVELTTTGSSTHESRSCRILAETPLEEELKVKTMTCKQMGGPCDASFHGIKADEVIKAQDNHLKEMVAGGDETHKDALKSMQDRWKHPLAGMGWYKKTKKDFAALPED